MSLSLITLSDDLKKSSRAYYKASKWGNDSTTEEQLRLTLEIAAAKLLGGITIKLPGMVSEDADAEETAEAKSAKSASITQTKKTKEQ